LERANFIDTLKENLKYFEERELYEECAKIHSGIQTLVADK
jgi:protein-arginine kinase activator protein McsA